MKSFLSAALAALALVFAVQAQEGQPCTAGYYKLRVTEAPVTAGPTYTDAIHYLWLDAPELDAQAEAVKSGARTLTARSCAYGKPVTVAVDQIVEAEYRREAWRY